MAVPHPQPDSSTAAGFSARWTRLATFVAPQLHAGEQVRAILSKSGGPHALLDLLGTFASLYGLADSFATHRAIVLSDRRVFVVRMPWRRSWSIERVSDLDAVAVTAFTPGNLTAGGLLFTPGNLRLQFPGVRQVDFSFGVGGAELSLLRAEAEAVMKAFTASAMSGDIRAR